MLKFDEKAYLCKQINHSNLSKLIIVKSPQPIPYQGSKRALVPLILNYFPTKVNRLIEPFAGSAALSIQF